MIERSGIELTFINSGTEHFVNFFIYYVCFIYNLPSYLKYPKSIIFKSSI